MKSLLFNILSNVSSSLREKDLTTLEGFMVIDFKVSELLAAEKDLNKINIEEVTEFYKDISYMISNKIDLSKLNKMYQNIFLFDKIEKLNIKVLPKFLNYKISFYNEFYPNILELSEEFKTSG